jgi:hypothetical protein
MRFIKNWFCAARVILILALVGCLYIGIGFEDTFSDLTFASRLIGAIVFLCGAIIFSAGFAAWQVQRIALRMASGEDGPWDKPLLRACSSLTIAGIVIAFLSSLILLMAQLIIYELTGMVVVWVLIALSSLWAFTQTRKAHLPVSFGAKNLISGLSVALLVPILGIAYTEFYLPSVSPEDLLVSASLSRATLNGSSEADIPVSITLTNQEQVGIYVLAAYYDVIGHTGAISKASPSDFLTNEDSAATDLQTIRRYVRSPGSYLLQEGPITSAGSFIDPGSNFDFKDTVSIPVPTSYDTIEVTVSLTVMRNDRATLDPAFGSSATHSWNSHGHNVVSAPKWVLDGLPSSTHFLEWYGRLEPSRLAGLMSRTRTVYVWYLLPSYSGTTEPNINADVSTTGTEPSTWTPSDSQRNYEHYGLEFLDGGDSTVAVSQLGIPASK